MVTRCFADERTAYRDTLALTAGKISGESFEVIGQTEYFCRCKHLFLDDVGVDTFEHKSEREVFVYGKVRIKRVRLEYHCYSSLARTHLVCELAVDVKLARGDVLQSRYHTQSRRLAATRIADKANKFAVLDFHVKVVNRVVTVRIDFVYVFE